MVPEFISVYIVSKNQTEAMSIARALVEDRLVACVNIFPGVQSFYRWRGVLESTEEAVLIAKSRADRFEAISEKVKSLHSYECPCIVASPISAASSPYLDWLTTELTME